MPPSWHDWLQESMGINATSTLAEFNNIWLPMPANTTNGYDATISCTMHSGYTYYLQAQFITMAMIVMFQVGGKAPAGRGGCQGLLPGSNMGKAEGRCGGAPTIELLLLLAGTGGRWHQSTTFRHGACVADYPGPLIPLNPPHTHPPPTPPCPHQVGGSILFILGHFWRRLSGMAFGSASMRRETYTPRYPATEATTSEFEIAIQPGSARFAAGHTLPPSVFAAHGGEDTPRSDNSPAAVRRRVAKS